MAQGVKIHGEKYRSELAAWYSHQGKLTPYIESGRQSARKAVTALHRRVLAT